MGWSPYLTLATPWTLCRLWFELHVGTFVLLNQILGTDLCFSQNKKIKNKHWNSGFFRWLTIEILMFLIWGHIFPPPIVLVLAFNFAYMCTVCCGTDGKPVVTYASLLWEKEVYDGAWAAVLLWSNFDLNHVTEGLTHCFEGDCSTVCIEMQI